MNREFTIEKLLQFTLGDSILEIGYIIASVLFVIGCLLYTSPSPRD